MDAVTLEIDFLWDFEPLHGVSPFADFLDVKKIDGACITSDAVMAIGAASKRKGWEEGVIDVANAAEGRRRIPDDTNGFHLIAELIGHGLFFAMDASAMSKTAEFKHLFAKVKAFFGIFDFINAKNGRKLFARERLFRSDFLKFNGNDRGIGWNLETALFGNPSRAHASNVGIKTAVFDAFFATHHAEHELLKKLLFFLVRPIDFETGEFLLHRIINGLMHEDGAFGSANHAIVEILRHDNVIDRFILVTALIDIDWNVTSTDAKSRLATAISRFDHSITARRQDSSDARMLHKSARRIHRRMFDPLNAILRRTSRHGRIAHDNRRRFGAILRFWMESEDDRVSRFDRNKRFENNGRSWIGHWGQTGDDADWFRNLGNAGDRIFFDDANGLGMTHIVDDIFASEEILRCFIFENAALCFFNGKTRQRTMVIKTGDRHLSNDVVNLFLVVIRESVKGFEAFFDEAIHLFLRIRDGSFFLVFFHLYYPSLDNSSLRRCESTASEEARFTFSMTTPLGTLIWVGAKFQMPLAPEAMALSTTSWATPAGTQIIAILALSSGSLSESSFES